MNFVFGEAYGCPEGYTPLMCAAHRSRLECCKALLRSGADPNYINAAGDLVLFWGIDGGIEIVKLLNEVRAGGREKKRGWDTNGQLTPSLLPPPRSTAWTWTRARPRTGRRSPTRRPRESTGWRTRRGSTRKTCFWCAPPSSATVHFSQLRHVRQLTHTLPSCAQYYGASKVGTGPERSGARSPRQSYNPEEKNFGRDRGSYQEEMPHP